MVVEYGKSKLAHWNFGFRIHLHPSYTLFDFDDEQSGFNYQLLNYY
jgi:hypothetical protein